MSESKIVVPAIPEAIKDKTFAASDIKWVKTVNDKFTKSAYLPPDKRVITNQNGVFFCLQLNPRFTASLRGVPIGDLILLYQNLDKQKVRCFTHLVTPIDVDIIQDPYPDPNGVKSWPGRWVMLIAMTGNQAANSIPFLQTIWPEMGFTGQMQDLSFQTSHVRKIPHCDRLPDLRNDIWSRFQPHMEKK